MQRTKYLLCLFIIICHHMTLAASKSEVKKFAHIQESIKCTVIDDPLEAINRKIFYFNGALDYLFLSPMSRAFNKCTNETVRQGVGNLLSNVSEPYTSINYLFQLRLKKSLLSFWKFVVNTCLGLGGVKDVAKDLGLEVQSQTFGSTLAYYGAGPGPYINLPFVGGISARDLPDQFLKTALNPVGYYLSSNTNQGIFALSMVYYRTKLMPMIDNIVSESFDPYVTIKSISIQNRESNMEYPSWFRCKLLE